MIEYKKMGGERLIMNKYLIRGSICFGLLALIITLFYFQQTVEASFRNITTESQNNQKINIQKSLTQNFTVLDNLETQHLEAAYKPAELTEKSESESEAAVSKARSFRATAYCLRGRTASGRMVRRGIVAADPRVLPLGTRIKLSAGRYSGTYLVADTGGKIKGRVIDIWVPSCSEARRWGRRNVKVTVLSKGKSRKSKKSRKRRKG